MKAKKALGQHFLNNHQILQKIVDALSINNNDTILEIGPGHGELTQFITINSPQKIIIIEKDKELIDGLNVKFNQHNIQIICGDALKLLSNINLPNNWKLVGNIPYYITGYLLRIIPDLPNPPKKIILLIQKEVAERVCSVPPKANLLSSMICGWATPSYLFTVSRNNFHPIPKVDSAVISLDCHNTIYTQKYFDISKALFRQPRKKAINNLRDGLNISLLELENIFKEYNIALNARAQNLSPQDILNISFKI